MSYSILKDTYLVFISSITAFLNLAEYPGSSSVAFIVFLKNAMKGKTVELVTYFHRPTML